MSATLDAEMFAQYYRHGGAHGNVPCLAAGGRTFPVQQVNPTSLHSSVALKFFNPLSSTKLVPACSE